MLFWIFKAVDDLVFSLCCIVRSIVVLLSRGVAVGVDNLVLSYWVVRSIVVLLLRGVAMSVV